jgi:hypothetical protein
MKPKTKRNDTIIALREKDPKKWSFDKLGEKFGLTKQTVFEIYHRERIKKGVGDKNSITKKYSCLD